MQFANQRRVSIEKEECGKQNHYSIINLEALNQAMNTLKRGSSFKLWMYLAKNQNGFQLDLSKVDCSHWGLKADSYHSAFKDLESKGYLQEIKSNTYIFHELLPEKP